MTSLMGELLSCVPKERIIRFTKSQRETQIYELHKQVIFTMTVSDSS